MTQWLGVLKPSIDELFLMLIWLRLNLSRAFTTWINFCYLYLGSLLYWPDRTTIYNTMPACMLLLKSYTQIQQRL